MPCVKVSSLTSKKNKKGVNLLKKTTFIQKILTRRQPNHHSQFITLNISPKFFVSTDSWILFAFTPVKITTQRTLFFLHCQILSEPFFYKIFNLAPGQQHFLTLFSVEKNAFIEMIKIECERWLQNGYLFRRSFVHILEMCIFFLLQFLIIHEKYQLLNFSYILHKVYFFCPDKFLLSANLMIYRYCLE